MRRQALAERGLRTIIEETLLDVMYEIPSRRDVRKCVISADTILRKSGPLRLTRTDKPADLKPDDLQETA